MSKQFSFQSPTEARGTYLNMQKPVQLFCQCVDTKKSSKQNNTEKENEGFLSLLYVKGTVVDKLSTLIL